MPSIDGRRERVEPGDKVTCRCGTVVDGDYVGPRGGRAWCWRRENGERFCSYDCAKRYAPVVLDEQVADDARGDWEADQAEAMFG